MSIYFRREADRILVKKIKINTPHITLGQLLQMTGLVASGGQVKWFVEENQIWINDQLDDRRGKKLYPDDIVQIEDNGQYQIVESDS